MGHAIRNRIMIALLALCLIAVPCAFGQEDPDNKINTQQMPDSSFLYDTSIYDLCNNNASYNDAVVQTTGEVVGDAVRDTTTSEKSWVTLSSLDPDHSGTIQVLINTSDLDLIDTYGRYGSVGTTLTVQGTFHLACSIHGGSMDIHADKVKASAPGTTTPDEFKIRDFIPGILFVIAGVVLLLVYRWMNERQQ